MKIVMYGTPLGAGGYLTEIPFLLNGKIQRIYKDAVDLQDLECDIAIANISMPPESCGNETGRNYLRIPGAKVQLCIQAEHFDEYIPEWADGLTHNFDGSICYPFNQPFWDFDDSIHDCFAKSYWEKIGAPIKPRFYFDPMVMWNHFYSGPVQEFGDYGYIIGMTTPHRNRVINSHSQFMQIFGDMREPKIQGDLRKSGIGFNVHKLQLKDFKPDTHTDENKYIGKSETIKMAFWYNLGMAVITEKLDKTFPRRFDIIECDDITKYRIDKKALAEQTEKNREALFQHHDLDCEQTMLINSIKKEFGI